MTENNDIPILIGTSTPEDEISQKGVPKVDQRSFAGALSQLGTFYASSMADTSGNQRDEDAMTRISAIASVPGGLDEYRRLEAGRAFNVLNDTYFLPTDDDEFTRLNKQHTGFTVALGGLYPAAGVVDAILAQREGYTPKVLDLGCGTGVWTLAMSKEFPHCQFVGIDLAPVPIEAENVPSNCRFELDDINNGLAHFHNSFDIIHTRLIAGGIRDFRKSKEDIEKCLKPGGIVLWIEGDYDMLSPDRIHYQPPASDSHPDGSWFGRLTFEARRAAVAFGRSDLDTMMEVLSAGLWDDPLLDSETCQAADLFVPVGPWVTDNDKAEAQRLMYVGALFRQDFMSGHRAFHAGLMKVGLSAETLNSWSDRADEEMKIFSKPVWTRFICAWGRRRAGPRQPAPPLPTQIASNNPGDYKLGPYKSFVVYESVEQTRRANEERNRTKTFQHPPLPPALQGQ
ncbi:hypothetical protein FRB91_001165 [Serendipita sp. 411]|nr:hypothetical protein FRC19_002862 [Serendipita sp. 401]KAG8856160.1 hypothetical protein FRB91_001165 [Serendipita sp. 411]